MDWNRIDKFVYSTSICATVAFFCICVAGITSNEQAQPGYTDKAINSIINHEQIDTTGLTQKPLWIDIFAQIMMLWSFCGMFVYTFIRGFIGPRYA